MVVMVKALGEKTKEVSPMEGMTVESVLSAAGVIVPENGKVTVNGMVAADTAAAVKDGDIIVVTPKNENG